MKVLILIVAIVIAFLMSTPGRAAFLVDETDMAENICPKILCLGHWNKTIHLMCSKPIFGAETPGKDYAFGSYSLGRSKCLCPCNFNKFYYH
jgi:hypothetical protein